VLARAASAHQVNTSYLPRRMRPQRPDVGAATNPRREAVTLVDRLLGITGSSRR
jgi:hypothetical protein